MVVQVERVVDRTVQNNGRYIRRGTLLKPRGNQLQFGATDEDGRLVDQHRVIGPLAIDKRTVAALGIPDVPLIVLEKDDGMKPAANRVGQLDLATVTTADVHRP